MHYTHTNSVIMRRAFGLVNALANKLVFFSSSQTVIRMSVLVCVQLFAGTLTRMVRKVCVLENLPLTTNVIRKEGN